MKTKVVFVTSHPIQYQIPIFRHLENNPEIEFSVLFAMMPNANEQGSGFDVAFEWDLPLMEGYLFKVLKNVSAKPGVTHFSGCDTPGVFRELKWMKPDAVVVNGWVVKTCLQALWACKRLGIPCIVRGEANDLRVRPAWKKWLQGLLVRQYAACLYIGEKNRQFYLARKVPDEKLFPARYCVESDRFEHQADSLQGQVEELRGQWNIPETSVCFIFCGKFENKKHPLELLQAFRMAIQKTTDLHLLMVGDGALRPECEAFVAEHGLPVSFAGFLNQTEIVKAYVAADCLVLPSDAGETWGLVTNEAMACGRPAIVSSLSGCAIDLVIPGKTGEVFEFGDWASLASLMVSIGSDRNHCRKMGENALRHVRHYSPKAAADGLATAVEASVLRTSRSVA